MRLDNRGVPLTFIPSSHPMGNIKYIENFYLSHRNFVFELQPRCLRRLGVYKRPTYPGTMQFEIYN